MKDSMKDCYLNGIADSYLRLVGELTGFSVPNLKHK